MASGCSYMGSRPFHHESHERTKDIEEEYDRLRELARNERSKRQDCFDRAHEAYESGDGAKAHELSEAGKRHAAKMDEYNRQASEFIFRENNAEDRVAGDEIDLHGQFVEEAEDILEERIRYAQKHGQTHLHVIVGKGNHSTGHVQKLKPRCEQVCRDLGLQFRTEENAGRIYVDLTGGEAHLPSHLGGGGQRPASKFPIATHNRPAWQQPQPVKHEQPVQHEQPHHQNGHAEKPHHATEGHSYADAVSGEPHAEHGAQHGAQQQEPQQAGKGKKFSGFSKAVAWLCKRSWKPLRKALPKKLPFHKKQKKSYADAAGAA
ncbi:putative smr domain-containing protein [Lasiodiplodia theobromae]|uniref:Smr domain-containing protein n=2 Tax=Lasiodiplodia TaxID=66739 RepID=A0A5N5DK92_9PEZI|nr:Smr domain-containing protein [Lasiodiplodia theobromae]KAF9637791.1 putative smr domain-containing protein [Lasiodiplodia theobromae]KAK0659578.1 Smr domain-containing protein C11H11.03c [Lasiodiplodia hormozganensis]